MGRTATLRTSREVADYLLCKSCERRFNEGGEKWVLEYSNQLDGVFKLNAFLDQAQCVSPPFVYDVSTITEIAVEKLAYFAASILWRGSAHQWRFGKQLLTRISLGPYEEELRQYLLGQAQFPRYAVLAVDVIADAILRRGVIPPFGGKREGGIWSYTLPFFGIVLTMVIGNTMSKSLRKHCTYPSERPFITRGMTKPETVLGWGMSLLSSSRTGGKLGRPS